MARWKLPSRNRLIAMGAAGVVDLGLILALAYGLATRWTAPRDESRLTVTEVTTPPPEPPTPPPKPVHKPEGGAAPPAPRREAKVEPSPRAALAIPTPAVTAVGAANAGSGSGAGGTGSGSGAGGGGSGSGSGGVAPAQRIAGRLADRDYPRDAGRAGGTVGIAFTVRADGGVDRCRVLASSGSTRLDTLTCSLVEQRFRYRPAQDTAGRPVDSTLRTSFTWGMR